MIPLSTTLVHGLLLCIPFTIFALISFWGWPRIWLHSLPPDIAALAGPKTPAEEKTTRVLLVVYLFILPGLSIVSTLIASQGIDLTFAGALIHIYGVWIIVHVWDFAVIDLAHVLLINPARPPIKGTEGAEGWKDLGFHFRSLRKAVPMSAIFVIPAAAVFAILV